MSDDWYNGLDLGKLDGLVFIDLKKAFDTVDHEILCKKLELYGVQQREPSWFRSCLSNRKRFCRVHHHHHHLFIHSRLKLEIAKLKLIKAYLKKK